MSASVENYNIWDNILGSVRKRLNGQIFETWFSPIELDHCDEENAVLHLRASQINKDWIDNNYLDLLGATMSELDLGNYRLKWKVEDSDFEKNNTAQNASVREDAVGSIESAITDPQNFQSSSNSSSTKFVDIEPIENTLNGKYTFEKFVVGSCNEFAHAAAEAIVEAPGKTYNPMFIYGGVGLGKTHLMHATGHAIIARNRHLRVAYITSEKFMNELINAIRFD
ncbi:MAG: chromosomal replication initiator protein DnaA, partial [Acidobacteria bacterium]|nr:chromosomal replication initiator protein DnaA [Acidobacteriota bacterium]